MQKDPTLSLKSTGNSWLKTYTVKSATWFNYSVLSPTASYQTSVCKPSTKYNYFFQQPHNGLPTIVKANDSTLFSYPFLSSRQVSTFLSSSNILYSPSPTQAPELYFLDSSASQLAYNSILSDSVQYIYLSTAAHTCILQLIPTDSNFLIVSHQGDVYINLKSIAPAQSKLSLTGLPSGTKLYYTITSVEGVMNLIASVVSITDTVHVFKMVGEIDDAFSYPFTNTLIYKQTAITNPQIEPFLPSLILDTLIYTQENMISIPNSLVHSIIRNQLPQVKIANINSNITAMQVFVNDNGFYKNKPLASYSNQNAHISIPVIYLQNLDLSCFLELAKFSNVAIITHAESRDLMWNIHLNSIEFPNN